MYLSYHYEFTAVSMIPFLDPYNPLAIIFMFLVLDIIPSIIASILLDVAGIDPFLEYLSDASVKTFVLYPLYPVFLPYFKHGYSILEMSTWLVFFFPVFEEVLFFAVPSMYGSLIMAIVCGLFWSAVHIARFMSWAWSMGYSTRQLIVALFAQIIAYIPPAYMSAILWVSGLGIASIILHSTHNALFVISYLRSLRGGKIEEVSIGKYYRIRRRKYYKIKYWEE